MRDNRFTVGTGEVGALFNACPEDVAVELDCLGSRRDDDEGCEGGIAVGDSVIGELPVGRVDTHEGDDPLTQGVSA